MGFFKENFGDAGIITGVLNIVVCAVLFAMMALTSLDVVLRYLFNSPILGVFEITEFMMVILVFFSLPYTQYMKKHVAVDFLVGRMRGERQTAIDLVCYLIYFLLLLAIAWKSVSKGLEVMQSKEISGTLSIPVYPFFFAVALGCAAMAFIVLKDIGIAVRQLRK